jgi:segregation and condensation protein A
MPAAFKLKSNEDYLIHLEVFEGPMDLLLHLIEREELPITSVSLARVTRQYLDHMEELEQLRPDDIAEFLVMAARLLYIKSVALLPRPELDNEEEEEDPGEALARQLREYKRFKEKAAFLKELEARGLRTYVRLAPPPNMEKRLDPAGLDVDVLLQALYEVLEEMNPPQPPVHGMAPLEVTIDEKLNELQEMVRRGKPFRFKQMLRQARNRTEIIVTFLAMLELIKQGQVAVVQDHPFADILIEPIPEAEAARGDDEGRFKQAP